MKYYLCLLCCLLLYKSFAQHASLNGQVTDADDKMGIAGASVFINNTTFGTICDDEGNFELKNCPAPPFELVTSSVGYKTTTLRLDTFSTSPLYIKLQQKTYDIGGVTIINPDKNGWEKYGKDFIENFIGYSPFARQCEILNKKDITFRYDADNYELEVSSSQPLQIRNKALGYTITYWLEDFRENYQEHTVSFKGYALFEPMKAGNSRKQQSWAHNRAVAYSGSVNHFMRAFFKGNVLDEGFEMRIMKRIKNEDYARIVPVSTDTIPINDTAKIKAALLKIASCDSANQMKAVSVFMQFMQWLHDPVQLQPVQITVPFGTPDSVATKHFKFFKDTVTIGRFVMRYYDYDRLSPKDSTAIAVRSRMDMHITGAPPPGFNDKHTGGTFDILYTAIMPIDTFRKIADSAEIQLRFNDYLAVTYTKEKPDNAYLERNNMKQVRADQEESLVIIKNPEKKISVYANGNYADPYDLFLEQYWSYEKLDKLLPLDYKPGH